MNKTLLVLMLVACSLQSRAQSALPTEFPSGAVLLSPEVLAKLLDGHKYKLRPKNGPEIRVEYKDGLAYMTSGKTADSGKWRVEGSAICVEWQKLPSGCSEVRLLGETLYSKRPTTGEVLPVLPD